MLIFGVKETDEEKLCDKVDVIFQQIEEKPRFEAGRVGRKSADKRRPVKVSLGNCSTVHQILVKARGGGGGGQAMITLYCSQEGEGG